jgi:hypothetical protein
MATYAAIFPPTFQPTGQPTKWGGGTKSYLLWELIWTKIYKKKQKCVWEARRLEDEKRGDLAINPRKGVKKGKL